MVQSDDPLDALAKAGEARHKVDVAEADRKTAKAGNESSKKNRTSPDMAILALSPLNWFWAISIWICLIGLFVAFVFGFAFYSEWRQPGFDVAPGATWPMWGALGCTAATPLIMCLPFFAKRTAIAAGRAIYDKERAWIAALPFTVDGYFETLGRHRWVKSAGRVGSQMISGRPTTYYDVYIQLRAGAVRAAARAPPASRRQCLG